MENKILVGLLLCLIFLNVQVRANVPRKFSGKLRGFYFNRSYVPKQESMALGGWINYNSPSWQGINFNLTAYTSQPFLIANPAYGGGNLLTPSQEGFTVLGQANISANFGSNNITIYRQPLNTPFVNIHDIRMIPKMFEAITFYSNPSPQASFTLSHVSKIKGLASTNFVPMSQFAGFAGTDKEVTLAGFNLSPSQRLQVQGWNYYCWDFMNILYLQADNIFPLQDNLNLVGSLQTIYQNSIGQAIAGNFSTGVLGIKGSFQWKNGLNLMLAYTTTRANHDIVNPWSGYPGFTSIIEEDCDLAGEQAWSLGMENNICQLGPGNFSAKIYYSQAFISGKGSFLNPGQYETDLILEYKLAENYYWRLKGAMVKKALDMGGLDYANIRFSVNYDL